MHFTGSEVLDMAVRIEENGMKFYNDAGKASKSKELKELFRKLYEEESNHKKVFENLKKLIPGEELSWKLDPDSEEDSLYLNALADSEVFTDKSGGAKLASKAGDARTALNAAIGIEKDSILFYNELKQMARERDKVILEDLIEEEKKHLGMLTGLLKTL